MTNSAALTLEIIQPLKKHLIPISIRNEPIKFADDQLKIVWFHDEIDLNKDIQDVMVNFTDSERHGVITTLKLFSLYETHAGSEYWGSRFKDIFDGSEFHRMASVFSMFELAVHAPFYNKINELLSKNTEDFYLSYLENKTLKDRIEHIGEIIDSKDDALSLAMFSMVEGVILYSSFAFLKHFQSKGKNKLNNLVRGIDFSLRDENIHSVAGAWCFRYLTQHYTPEMMKEIKEKVIIGAEKILEHENEIVNMVFEKGKIEGITINQLNAFVKSRINDCMVNLGFENIYDVTYNPIKEWFYKAINDYAYNDFFAGIGKEYQRNFSEDNFVWIND